jgi:hypothetical protein
MTEKQATPMRVNRRVARCAGCRHRVAAGHGRVYLSREVFHVRCDVIRRIEDRAK